MIDKYVFLLYNGSNKLEAPPGAVKGAVMRIGVYTNDAFLLRKISLILKGTADVFAASTMADAGAFDLMLLDCRDGNVYEPTGSVRVICIVGAGQETEGTLPYPFSYDSLIYAVSSQSAECGARLILEDDREHVRLDGDRIRLTEVEGKLLSAILAGGGDYVTREALTEEVWHGTATPGVLNVYVHYLREKLEANGEKIIISSRKCGYKIDAKYTGGAL